MNLKYELTGKGWADGNIEVNSTVVNFTTSYLSDPLLDLLHSLISLIPECVPYPLKKTTFEWYDEPGRYTWKLERINNEQLSIEISNYEDTSSKSKINQHLYEVCNINDFSKTVVKELENILKMHGIKGYKELWVNHEFPIKEFRILKEYIDKIK